MTASPSQTPVAPPSRKRQRGGRKGSTSSATTCAGPRGLCTTTPREVLARATPGVAARCPTAGAALERGAAHHDARRRGGGLERGRQRGQRGGADAEENTLRESDRIQRHLAHREDEVEVVDRARDEPQQALRHAEAEPQSQEGAGDADDERLAHDEREDLAASYAVSATSVGSRREMTHRSQTR